MAHTSPSAHAPRRSSVPIVFQMEDTECGAASLTMVLNALGRTLRLSEVRDACAVTRDGVSFPKIVHAASTLGFDAELVACDADGLRGMPTPCIAAWDGPDAVVVERRARGRVHIVDPAVGRRTMRDADVAEHFRGTVVVVRTRPGFVPEARPHVRRPVFEILSHVQGDHAGLVYAALAGVALVVPATALAILAAIFVTQVLDAGNQLWATRIVSLAVAIVVLQFFLVLFQQRVLLRLQTKLIVRITAAFVWHLLRLPMEFFGARSPGGLVGRVYRVFQIASLLSMRLATVAIGLLTMALFAVALLVFDWRLGLVAIVVAIGNVGLLAVVSRWRVAMTRKQQHNLLQAEARTFMAVDLIDDIKATDASDDMFSSWAGTQARVLNAGQALGALDQVLLTVPGFLTLLNVVVILAVGGQFVLDGTLSLAALIAFQLLATSFFAPISGAVANASRFQNARAWLQQIADVADEPADPLAVGGGPVESLDKAVAVPARHRDDGPLLRTPTPRQRLTGHVRLDRVTFGYVRGEAPLLDGFSLDIEPGKRVALVGPTGGGKSTIANLVAGLLHPWSGHVLFDGVAREALDPGLVSASLAKVDQTPVLFGATIAQNISFFDRTMPVGDIVRAAQDACIATEIDAMSGGYGRQLRDGAKDLSTGQKARVEIARALARDPAILVLDEATSSLDPVIEARIDANVRRRGCTTIIVAHRLSTIRDCDQIIVVDRGTVAERGTHEELMDGRGRYAELVLHD